MTRAGALALALGIPVGLLAFAVALGLGLTRDIPLPAALTVSGMITLAPAVGLASPSPRRALALGLALFAWGGAFTALLPAYLPGERGPALTAAVSLVADPPPAPAAALIAALTEDAPAPAAPIPPKPPLAPAPEAVVVEAPPPAPAEPLPSKRSEGEHRAHFEGVGRSLIVPVTFTGPLGEARASMIFDTGATLTTLSPEIARRVGARVSGESPTVTLNTAGGSREEAVGLVDQASLGGATVSGLSVAICDGCAPGADGLLGLNFSNQFVTAVDHDDQAIVLTPRGEGLDRLTDVGPWVKISSSARATLGGAVEMEVEARSLAPREIQSVDVEVSCGGDAFSVEIDHIPPRGAASTQLTLPTGTPCARYRVQLIGGRW